MVSLLDIIGPVMVAGRHRRILPMRADRDLGSADPSAERRRPCQIARG